MALTRLSLRVPSQRRKVVTSAAALWAEESEEEEACGEAAEGHALMLRTAGLGAARKRKLGRVRPTCRPTRSGA